MFKKVSGTKDILPGESNIWQEVEEISRKVFTLYNFQEIRTPLIEEAALFNRSLGESTEIVQKQMFLIQNKDELYALRPEGTASIIRAYIENNLDKTKRFSKFYYTGPMFRLERPQKGRMREFHHIGCEAVGSYEPSLDIEIIALADKLLRSLSVSGYKIKINSLGCSKDKAILIENLRKELKEEISGLCEDCKNRLEHNVLRILDCKNESCKQIVRNLSNHKEFLCNDCGKHFSDVKEGLDSLGIEYEVDNNLVRGLDYYTQTVFEMTHDELGSQDAIGAGGRYNNLVSELGGSESGAVGFAFGTERLLLVKKPIEELKAQKLVYIITLDKEALKCGIKVLNTLRENSIISDMDYENKSIKGAMRKASDLRAAIVLIIGENELKNDSVTLKIMDTGVQKEVKIRDLIGEIKC
jgi:histidyl-tRNA synthetase